MRAACRLTAIAAAFIVATAAATTTTAAARAYPNPKGFVMPWMCLERCGFNASAIRGQIDTMARNADVVQTVSFEWYDLGPNGTLVNNSFTSVAPTLKRLGFVTNAMDTTADLTKMREVWASPAVTDQFLHALDATLADVIGGAIDGVNFDWEPPAPPTPTPEDGLNYALFLRRARQVLGGGRSKAFVSVDIATWSAVWNWSAIRSALTDPADDAAGYPRAFIAPMSTYTYNDEQFLLRLANDANAFGNLSPNLVVGLDAWRSSPHELSPADVAWRLETIRRAGMCRVGIWEMPLPASWWPALRSFAANCGWI